MTSRAGAALAFLISSALATAGATAKTAPVHIEQVIADAHVIAIARIIQVSPVTFEFDKGIHTCGFRYRASVERAFKGASAEIEFFDASTDEPLEPSVRFVAFLFRYDAALAERSAAKTVQHDLLGAKYLCQLRSSSLAVKDVPRTLMRFSDRMDSAEWIIMPYPNPGPVLPRTVERRAANSEDLASWDDIAQIIERVLAESATNPE